MGVTLAVVRREFQVQCRYPLSMVNLVLLTPLYELALPALLLGSAFLVNGSAVGLARLVGTTDLAAWLGVGVFVASLLVGAVMSVAGTVRSDRVTGVLEHSWATPASREAFVLGAVLTGTLFTVASSGLLIAVAVVFLGASYSPPGLVLSIPVCGVMLLGNCGLGYLAAAAGLRLRRPEAVLDPVMALAATFSGVAFPLTVLPEALRVLTYPLPATWCLDLLRHLTVGTAPLAPPLVELAAATATSLAFFFGGRWVFLRTERQVMAAGTLTQF
ncbi:ABC transporter permease [Nonomuraea sp. NPDC049695]|uniref:ABC transporter permease n=1 Tax=Nonomuraea sp. NPDC049695 TaxID=3154734 RepID=UPI003448852D